ncbi:transporter substrate-binding domain-containing protein [Agarivorans aestuarii]|uniref:Transporter substrate-binding domain-containing protein n=1 Tax=Agarivorans aestuarii TaxID=1563703 RepID=A0ABU7G6B3_9ALTE|nr:transporter substrate-binding domain-containing protein [Agarivorans aestuarii]MEE1674947.1 transporter substrate-binding domain-containing protein [Agarivorans aestuarii]
MRTVCLFMLTLCCAWVSAEPSLRISTAETIAAYPKVRDTVTAAYSELGYTVEIVPMPAKRSLHHARDNHHIDAELARTRYASAYLPNHILIPVAVGHITIAAFVKKDKAVVTDWHSLQQYRVAGVRGHLFLEDKLRNHSDTQFFNSAHQALTMLGRGRVDVVILPLSIGEYVIKKYWHKQITTVSPALDYVPLYHFLHNKHQDKAEQLAEVLQKFTTEPLAQRQE